MQIFVGNYRSDKTLSFALGSEKKIIIVTNTMSQTTLESDQMKALIKQAILELFQENRETVTDALTEILEDIALGRAMAEAEDSELVSREAVFKILESVE